MRSVILALSHPLMTPVIWWPLGSTVKLPGVGWGQRDVVAGDEPDDAIVGPAGADEGEVPGELSAALLERAEQGVGAQALVLVGERAVHRRV